jgi:methionyl-tRNA synthetase
MTPEQISVEDFRKAVLRVGKVIAAERIPKSTKLLKLQVDIGAEQRQIVAGIGTKYTPEEMLGKRIVIVANLKPAKLMGVESQGMVLAAGDQEVTALLTTIEDVPLGSKIK